MNGNIKKAIEAIKVKGLRGYCPFNIKEVSEISTNSQVKSFCKDGCSVECPKFYLEKLEKRIK